MNDPITVLLVDDEPLAIEDLQDLIRWPDYGFKIVGKATDGQEALELVERLQPNLVITDIRMPVCDGLEFIRRTRLKDQTLEIILLTSYGDFQYAMEAIRLGVSGYLLKHEISDSSLTRELAKVRERYLKRQQETSMLTTHMLSQLLNRIPLDPDSYRELEDRLGNRFVVLIVQQHFPYPLFGEVPFRDKLETALIADCMELPLFSMRQPWELLTLQEGTWALFSANDDRCSEKQLYEKLYQAAVSLRQKLSKSYSHPFSIIMSSGSDGIRELPGIGAKAATIMKYTYFAGEQSISTLSDWLTPIHYQEPSLQIGDWSLLDAEAKNRMDDLFQSISKSPWNSPGLQSLTSQLLFKWKQAARQTGKHYLVDLAEERELESTTLYHIGDIKEWFMQRRRELLDGSGHLKVSRPVALALEHISRHYAEDLSNEEIAKASGISAPHLQRLLKKEMDRTIHECLMECRIRAAQQWLEHGELKLYEIAEKAGFNSSQHFAKVFHKMTGCTPLEYKQGKRYGEQIR